VKEPRPRGGELGPGMRRAHVGGGDKQGPRAPEVILGRLAADVERAAQALRYWDAAPLVRQKIRELYSAIDAERGTLETEGEGEGGVQ
jgi:hypothetical protein